MSRMTVTVNQEVERYTFGQTLFLDCHFEDHMLCRVPVQVYFNGVHEDIGFIEGITDTYVIINHSCYHRGMYTFVSRPGY